MTHLVESTHTYDMNPESFRHGTDSNPSADKIQGHCLMCDQIFILVMHDKIITLD